MLQLPPALPVLLPLQIVRAEADLEEARQRAARQQQYYEERQAAANDTEAEVRGILQEAESAQRQVWRSNGSSAHLEPVATKPNMAKADNGRGAVFADIC